MAIRARPENLLALDPLQAGVLVSQQPAIAQPQQDVSIVEWSVLNTIDFLLVYKGHNLQLLNLLCLQVEDHDALVGYLFTD